MAAVSQGLAKKLRLPESVANLTAEHIIVHFRKK
jgi:hypothetical protein